MLEDLGAAGLREVRMIEAALDRIENGSYGVCVRCGEPIGDDAPRRGAAHSVLPGLRRRPLSYPSDGLATISQTIARTAAKAGRPQANQMR